MSIPITSICNKMFETDSYHLCATTQLVVDCTVRNERILYAFWDHFVVVFLSLLKINRFPITVPTYNIYVKIHKGWGNEYTSVVAKFVSVFSVPCI